MYAKSKITIIWNVKIALKIYFKNRNYNIKFVPICIYSTSFRRDKAKNKITKNKDNDKYDEFDT